MRFIKLALLLMVLLSFSMMALAQDDEGFVNDPTVNEDANACLAGGSMEGKCDGDSNGDSVVTEDETEWAWICGWYLIRFEFGLISEATFPSDCAILISYYPNPACFVFFEEASFFYNGIPNEIGNAIFFTTANCSGQGENFGDIVIESDNPAEVEAICAENSNGFYEIFLIEQNDPGADVWLCFIFDELPL